MTHINKQFTINHAITCKYRVSQKNGPVWALITQRWLVVERRVLRQKFQNGVKNKWQICIVKHLNLFLPNLHKYSSPPKFYQISADWSLESMCSGSAEPSIQLAHVLTGQLLKFCNHAICCNAPTLNNSQNLNLDFLSVGFWVQWTRAHGSAGKCLISGVMKI